MQRRHDIDALRVLAFAGVMLYHVGMFYVADWGWHLKSEHAATWLQMPMRALNLWRMDLVFLVSGVALSILVQKQSAAALFKQRSLRLLLPLVFGMAVVVPFQPYAQAVANGSITPGFGEFLLRYYIGGPWPVKAFDGAEIGVTWNHLWYLPYLWFYTVIALALLPLLRSQAGRALQAQFLRLRGAALVLPALLLCVYAVVLWPRFPATHALFNDWYLHANYFTFFIFGLWLGTHQGAWQELARVRLMALISAVGLLLVFFTLRGMAQAAPSSMWLRVLGLCVREFYTWAAILAVLGYAHAYLNRPWRWLAWARESVYPWYVLHQTLIILFAFYLAPMHLPAWLEACAIVLGTIAGCWLMTDALIRRVAWLRPLFGLAPHQPSANAASVLAAEVNTAGTQYPCAFSGKNSSRTA